MRSAIEYHASSHPEVIARQDALLLGIYRAMCDVRTALVPAAEALPDFQDMTDDYLQDLVVLLAYDKARLDETKKESHRRRGR